MSGSPALPHIDFESEKLQMRLQMEIAADPTHVSEAVSGIMKMIGAMECACGHEYEIELALQEAMVNAVVHGAQNDPQKKVACKVACEEEHGMLIIVSDPGDGFDPSQVPDPLQAENLFSNHGRGIYLINRLMDHVEFKRGGAEIHMRKLRRPQ